MQGPMQGREGLANANDVGIGEDRICNDSNYGELPIRKQQCFHHRR